jgi:hypothetical protein
MGERLPVGDAEFWVERQDRGRMSSLCGADADTVYLDSIRNPLGPGRLPTDNQSNCEARHLE